jgi:DNA-binding transcriptional ArsR family regulator
MTDGSCIRRLECMADTEARAVLLHGLGDHSRLALIELLADGGRRVSDLTAASGLSQSNVSKHLACLWDCGLVERERRGREIHYRLVDGLADLLHAADRVLERTGDRVLACPRYGRLADRRAA